MSENHTERGKFAPGNQAAKGHGRPPKAREAALLAIGQEIVNASAWRGVVVKAVLDAQGKTIDNGQIVDDPNSTAQGRNTARVWLRDTFIGKPDLYVKTDTGDESAYSQLDGLTDAELAGLLDEIRSEIEQTRTQSGGDSASPGQAGASGADPTA